MEDGKSPTRFVYCNRDFADHVCWSGCGDRTASMSKFDTTIQAGWTDRMERGLFRYHLGDLETRILPGPARYVAQLNIQRGIERRQPQEILSIKQNFDTKQFNFNKINPEEVIFEMSKQIEPTSQPKGGGPCKENGHPCDELCRIMVMVNVSPLEFGHCLLVPEPTQCSPQVLTPAAIQIGIESVLLSSDPGFRVGFNSLGAFASVNHLHLHGYYMKQELNLETASTQPLVPEKGFYRLRDFPIGFMFYAEMDDLEKVVCAISQVTNSLVERNKAHNLFFTRGCPPGKSDVRARRGVRIVVWPRRSCFGAKDESAFNVALCELAGHLPFKNRHDFEHSTEKDVMAIIQSSTQDVPSIEDRNRDTGTENYFQGNLLRQRWRDSHHPGSSHPGTHSSDSNNSNMEDEEQEPGRRAFTLHLGQALRTRQLVIDFDGERPIPRLREPLDLFAIPSTPFQGVRWPIEYEVFKEAIHHIEWDPPDPEPFYQPTGHERAPMPVGEEKGNMVYCIDPGTKTSYFTYSRVGGSRGPIKSSTSCAMHQDKSTLAFESRFESGNLQKAVQVGVHDYELTLRTDMYTTKHTQWFYFRVRNMKAGVTYRFTIVNLMKASSLYCLGMRPLLYSERAAWEKGEGWRRTGSNIRYYRNQHHQAEQDNNTTTNTKSLHSLTWTGQFPYDFDTCYLAHCYPYTYSHLQRYLSRLTSNSATGAYCKLRVLCRSLAGNAVHVLTVTSPGGGWMDRSAKRAVVVTARVHPGETNSSWMMQGFLDFLLGESDDARLLRETFVFKVVPMLNPDGVVVGNYRCSLAGRDLNRNYNTLLRDSFPCVWHTRNMVKRLMAERDVVLYCDFHGHSRKNNVFMYGCTNSDDATQRLHERVFPLMMSKNANDKFSFRSCKFRVHQSKEGTGRVVMWRLGIRNSYTMESTFGGSTLGNRKGTHFTTRDLKSLGYYLCDTLLDYCDPDPTKTSHCLAELRAMLRQELRERLGREVDSDGSLSVSISDIESSTSGSNSTESDGLPVHLLNRIDEQSQVKKKHLRSGKERNRLRQERVRNVDPKVLHRNIKNIDPVLPTEDMVKVRIQEKTVAVVREKKKKREVPFVVKMSRQTERSWIPHPTTRIGVIGHVTLWQEEESEKNEYMDAVRAAYLRTQPPVTAVQQRGFSVPVPTSKIRVHTTPIQQQPMPFSPDHRSHAGMRERMPALHTSSPLVVPGMQCRVVPEFIPPQGLEPCRSSNVYPAKSHHQRPRPEKQGHAARVSKRYYMPEAPTSNTDALEPLWRSPERDCTAGVSDAMPVGEQDQSGPQAAFEKPPSKPGTDGNSFLPDLRHIDFRGKSYGCLWADQAGAGVQRQGPSKREPLRGGEGRRVCGGDAAARRVKSNHRLAQQTLQEEDKQEMGILPQMSSTTHTKIDHLPRQLDSLRRLQKLSLANTSRFHSSGRGAEAGTGLDLEKRMVARPSGSAPPRSTAPLS